MFSIPSYPQLLSNVSMMTNSSTTEHTSNAITALVTLQGWYNPSTGLWNSTGWWNSANCLTVLATLAAIDPNIATLAAPIFANTFLQAQKHTFETIKVLQNGAMMSYTKSLKPSSAIDQASLQNPRPLCFLNAYYDDEGWWALAWIRVFSVTGSPHYLSAAVSIFQDMVLGSHTPCGGIWWDKRRTYVNAIANELFLSIAAHLANRIPNKKQYYLDVALQQWAWFRQSGMINTANLINDGLDLDICANNGRTVWSYNQGVILGALVELTSATGNTSYVATAKTIASAAILGLTDANGILHEPCEPQCGADGAQFKGVFVRNLLVLQMAAPEESYATFIRDNADSIWENARNTNDELGLVWSGPFEGADAATQSSALDALVAAAALGNR